MVIRSQPVDARSDIFSFGLVLYEMCTGRRAFDGGTSAEIMTAILRQELAVAGGRARTEEVALPVTMDRFRVQPYLTARYSPYDDAPDGTPVDRRLVGAGERGGSVAALHGDAVAEAQRSRLGGGADPEVHQAGESRQ